MTPWDRVDIRARGGYRAVSLTPGRPARGILHAHAREQKVESEILVKVADREAIVARALERFVNAMDASGSVSLVIFLLADSIREHHLVTWKLDAYGRNRGAIFDGRLRTPIVI